MNRRVSYIFLIVAAVLLSIYLFTSVFAYIVIALVITSILSPVIDGVSRVRINQYRTPRLLAVFMSFGLMFFVLYLFVILFIPLISEQIEVLKGIEHDSTHANLTEFEEFLISNGLVEAKLGFVSEWIMENKNSFLSTLDLSTIINRVFSITGTFFVGLLAVFFFAFFFLSDKTLVERIVLGIVPNRFFEMAITIYSKVKLLLSKYLVGLVIQMSLIFSCVAIGLTIVGVKYAFTIALFSAIANLIPYVGPWIGAIFGLWVSVSTGSEYTGELYLSTWGVSRILIVYIVVQLMDNMIFQPWIFSKSVKAHPLEIFVVIFAGGILFGPLGMVMAIPGYTLLKVFVSEVYFGVRRYHIFQE